MSGWNDHSWPSCEHPHSVAFSEATTEEATYILVPGSRTSSVVLHRLPECNVGPIRRSRGYPAGCSYERRGGLNRPGWITLRDKILRPTTS